MTDSPGFKSEELLDPEPDDRPPAPDPYHREDGWDGVQDENAETPEEGS